MDSCLFVCCYIFCIPLSLGRHLYLYFLGGKGGGEWLLVRVFLSLFIFSMDIKKIYTSHLSLALALPLSFLIVLYKTETLVFLVVASGCWRAGQFRP
eukprot:m.68086 g.68086  ORF g.68086 m.68086 type:complete len:97 (-) comp19863_c0_seq2:590-880(-)